MLHKEHVLKIRIKRDKIIFIKKGNFSLKMTKMYKGSIQFSENKNF